MWYVNYSFYQPLHLIFTSFNGYQDLSTTLRAVLFICTFCKVFPKCVALHYQHFYSPGNSGDSRLAFTFHLTKIPKSDSHSSKEEKKKNILF